MRAIILAFLAALLTAPDNSRAQTKTEDGLITYDVPRLQRIMRAVDLLKASGADLDDYDVVSYSLEKEGFYLITFTTDFAFAEEGPKTGEDVRMLFNDETDALIVLEADPLPKLPDSEN